MRIGDVKPFKYVYADDRQQFARPLEEAAEFSSHGVSGYNAVTTRGIRRRRVTRCSTRLQM